MKTFEEYMESVFSVDMESRQYRYEDMHEAWQEAQEETAKRILDAFALMDMEVGVGAGYKDWFSEMYLEFLSGDE